MKPGTIKTGDWESEHLRPSQMEKLKRLILRWENS
jgi:hypothetical protein